MAKLTAWLVTIIGLLLVPPIMNFVKGLAQFDVFGWLLAVLVIVIGVGKLMRNYKR